MLDNALKQFSADLFILLCGKPSQFGHNSVIKKHTENLKTFGDFSFPNKLEPWHSHLDVEESCKETENKSTLLKLVKVTPEDLILRSEEWRISIQKVDEIKDRIHVFLNHCTAITVGIQESLKNNELLPQILHSETALVSSDPTLEKNNDLTTLRVKCVAKAVENLYVLSPECKERAVPVFVTSKHQSFSENAKNILCGTVLNAKTCVKETNVSADDFIKIRQQEMSLIAQHKYGVRVQTDPKWTGFIARLGESAVTFEMLQVKPSSAVKVDLQCSAGSSKGAAFILYNCARLETMLRTYQDKVETGYYPPLPDIHDVDFTLLTHEDEWTLTFNYILGLPHAIHSCLDLGPKVEFRPHYVCNFLCSMVRIFSQYYRRVRVLMEARSHLLPVMYARIYMLKALMGTLKNCLEILNIRSVTQM